MADARAELERLRKLKRLQELEAKASAQSQDQESGLATQLKGAAAGATQGLTFGYAPQVYGGLQSLVGGDYTKQRDIAQKALSEAESEAPVAAAAGQIGSMFIPGAGSLGLLGKVGKGITKILPKAAKLPKFLKGAGKGAAVSAVYNPGDAEGVIDPLQLEERAKQAAVGGAVGGVLGGIGKAVEAPARRSRMVGKIKQSGKLSTDVRDEIKKATQALTEKQVKPRQAQLKELLKGKGIDINPERLKDISPGLSRYAQALQSTRKLTPEGRTTIPADRALRLKQILDRRAGYARSQPFSEAAQAKGEQAKKAADLLRGKLTSADPKVSQLQKETAEAIRLRDYLTQRSKTAPIASIKGAPGTDRGSIIDRIDELTGSKLERLAQDIDAARTSLLRPAGRGFFKPLAALEEMHKVGRRAGGALSRAIEPTTTPQSAAGLAQLLAELERYERSK